MRQTESERERQSERERESERDRELGSINPLLTTLGIWDLVFCGVEREGGGKGITGNVLLAVRWISS